MNDLDTVEEHHTIAVYGKDKDNNPCDPNRTQARVLAWKDQIVAEFRAKGELDHIPVLLLQGGVGSGKSRAALAPAIEMLFEWPDIRVLWGRQDFKDIKLSIMDKFFEIVPRDLVVNKSEQYHYYDIDQGDGNTGRIYFNGLKDIGGLSSQEFGVIIVTEAYEISEQAYRALKRRARQEKVPTFIIMESEPPNVDHWLCEVTDPAHDSYDPDITKWEISTYENWDNLPTAYKTSLENMPDSWKNKYLMGNSGFIPDGKPFYPVYKANLHKYALQWAPEKEIIRGMDFGYHHPACIYCQIDSKGRLGVLKELMGWDMTLDKFIDEMFAFENRHFPEAQFRTYWDPAGNQVSDKNDKTSHDICVARGIIGTGKTSCYKDRKEIIEGRFSKLIGDYPAVIIDESCRIFEEGLMGGYHYPVKKPGVAVPEEPVKDGFYEHLMNCFEYVMVNLYKPTGNVKKRNVNKYNPARLYPKVVRG